MVALSADVPEGLSGVDTDPVFPYVFLAGKIHDLPTTAGSWV